MLALANPAWIAEGPGPRTGATASVPDQNNSAIGAVNAVVFLDANTALAASVNGGIWRTTNFNVSNPTWTSVSGNLASPSISAIGVSLLTSALPANQQIVFAGTGGTSSYFSVNSAGNFARTGMAAGLFESTDGGQTWQPTGTLAGTNPATNPFLGSTINSIVPTRLLDSTTGQPVVLVGADNGLWRSADGGATFSLILSGRVTSIVADPSDLFGLTYYASVISTSGQYQVNQSVDGGNSWSPITPSFPATGDILQTQLANLKLAVFPGTNPASRALYAGLVTTSFSSSAPFSGTITDTTGGTYTVAAPANGLSNGDWVHVPYTLANGSNSAWNYQVTVINNNTFTIRDPAGPVLSLGPLTFTTGNFVGRVIVYQSTNEGSTWQQATVDPMTLESSGLQPLYAANQNRGSIQTNNFAIAVDPTNRNIVYVSGSTQPSPISSVGNALWSGRLFRGDFSNTAQTTWTPITDVYAGAGLGPPVAATSINSPAGQPYTITAPTRGFVNGDRIALLLNSVYYYYYVTVVNSDTFSLNGTRGSGQPPMTSRFTIYQVLGFTAPHADSRSLSFSPSGNLVETDDGGIYVRSSPTSGTGTWSSANGNMSDSELTGIAFDSLNNVIIGGSQDNGVAAQVGSNNLQWSALLQADGNIPQVDNLQSMHPGESIYYYSVQNLGAFTRQIRNSSNQILQTVNPPLNVAFYDLLLGTVTDPSQIPTTGQNQVVVASLNNILYFRVFNQSGNMIVNATEQDFPNERDLINKIRNEFASAGPNPSWNAKQTLVQDVAQLTGFTNPTGQTLNSLSSLSAPFYDTAQFYNPFVVDSVASTTGTMGWLLLGMNNYLYESTDGGNDWTRVGPALPGAPTALAYGGMLNGVANPSVAYVGVGGSSNHLYLRTRLGGRFNPVTAYTGNTPTAIAVDPDNWNRAYIVDTNGKIWMTANGGASFTEITGSLSPSNQSRFALAVYDQPAGLGVNESNDDVVFVGGWGGVWAAENPQAGVTWTKFGTNMPNVLVNSLIYNATDNVLLASTLGSGALEVPNLSASVFQPANPGPGPRPFINVPGPQSTDSNTPLLFSTQGGNAISIADPGAEPTNTFSVTLSVTNGNLTLGALSGLDAPDDAGASAVKTFEGSLSDINAALDGLSFQSDQYGSPSVLTVSVDDQNPADPMTDTQVVAIKDLAGNGTPAPSVPGAPTAATSPGPVIAVPPGPFTVGINSGNLPINGITLSDPSNSGGQEMLTVYVSGGSLTFSNNATLSDGSTFGPISDTLANLNGYFQNNGTSGFSFTPTPDFQGTAWIMITLDDGTQSSSNPATAWIQINVAAAPPTVAAPQNLATAPNTPLAFGSQSADVTVASSDPVSQTLEVFVSAENGLLALPDTTGVTVLAGDPTGDDYLDITGMPDAINSALASMAYTPNPGFRGFDTLSIDVVNTGGWSDISPPPFTDLTDDGGPPDNGGLSGGGGGDVFPSTAPVFPSTPVNWDASLATTAISILVDHPPVAVSAGGPYTIPAGGSLGLAGSAYDADGVPLTYEWGINGAANGSITGSNPTLTWAQLGALGITGAGTYSVTVSADDGLADPVSSAPVRLTVLPVAPVLRSVSATPASAVGATLLTGTIQEPDPSESFSLVVSWGDGSVSTTPLAAGAKSFQVGHQYAVNSSRPSSLPILAVLRDSSGLTTSAQTPVDLRGVVTVIGPGAGVSGQPLAFNAVLPSGGLPGALLEWDFGDGQVSPVVPAGASVPFTHAYAAPGRYSASLRIITASGTLTSPVTVKVVRAIQVPDALGGTDLFLGGTPGNDVFRLRSIPGGGISAVVDGQPLGIFFGSRAVIIYGDGGKDRVVRTGRFPVRLVSARPQTLIFERALPAAALASGAPSTSKR